MRIYAALLLWLAGSASAGNVYKCEDENRSDERRALSDHDEVCRERERELAVN